ncbi:MAG: TIGR00645 family protein [Gammaproteobacteria bacterium]|nr:TIGR00645 family protein [Gammaproteobacteria bacterium]NVK88171.1 TIGR00645 family protein [Gammaproteobacteria bacterium]
MKQIEHGFEKRLFSSRWLLAPFYVGLLIAVALLLLRFFEDLIMLVPQVFSLDESTLVLKVLTLVDLCLMANLLVIIVFSSYESFVSRVDIKNHSERPSWLGRVGFSSLKVKVISSIAAISAIELLKVYLDINNYSHTQVLWMVIIFAAFVVAGVLFALMDRMSSQHH